MNRSISGKTLLFGYFIAIIFLGSLLLTTPLAWQDAGRLRYLDALFTATSAVCVTGLIVVDTSEFSLFGIIVIMVLIQAGGLGIIAFGTLLLTGGGRKLSLANRRLIKEYSIESVEYEPKKIVTRIVALSIAIEALGAAVLMYAFHRSGAPTPVLNGIFHSISAFANAGFSLFDTSLEQFVSVPLVIIPIAILLTFGGIGFVVVMDVTRRMTGAVRVLSLHTRIVLIMTVFLGLSGTLVFFVFEGATSLAGASVPDRLLASFFQAVTPRTAGFNSVTQSDLSMPSQIWTVFLMFIGGAPGSIAGGVKVTTIVLVFMLAIRRREMHADIRIGKRKISPIVLNKAASIVIKALLVLAGAVFLLSISENWSGQRDFSFMEVLFETVSAFSTVGLSLGITAQLSDVGRVIIIAVMFTGRLGIMAMAMPGSEPAKRRFVSYPEGNVLLG
jgi:trk system potassium uptake protein TrkH